MAFSAPQHYKYYRPISTKAARLAGVNVKDKKALDAWLRANLREWLGVESTNELSPMDDFTYVMKQYEGLIGDGIRWHLAYEQGPVRRAVHKIRQICEQLHLDEDYARGLSRNALQLDRMPLFEELNPKQLQTIIRTLKAQGNRIAAAAHAGGDDNEPF